MAGLTYKTNLALILLLLALSIITFWPGTSGDFIIDDYHNLSPLSKIDSHNELDSFRQFVFGGASGPTGRPISLASFLIDAQTWPAEPYSFKRTNIFIHCLNGLIIFAVFLKLFQLLGRRDSSAATIAFIGALIWLIHPLHTSTVHYVIQRMTELSAMFVLIGIWCYLHGRQKLLTSTNPGPGYLWMSTGIIAFGLLATLSKENGVLLPLYIVIVEYTLLRQLPRPGNWRYWATPILAAPIILLVVYLGINVFNHSTAFIHRDFSLYERLITEPRVLLDYLGKLFFPINTPSLNHDDFITSRSLFSPASTLPSIILVSAAFVFAIKFNKKSPILSFAILWFIGGHLLESSVLPLEIYFEHRNYLPMLGIALAIAFFAEKHLSKNKKTLIICITAVALLEGTTTWNYSKTWGDKSELMTTWAEQQPKSKRAQMLYALLPIEDKNFSLSYQRLSELHSKYPNNLTLEILYINSRCQTNQSVRKQLDRLIKKTENIHIEKTVKTGLAQLFFSINNRSCNQSTPEDTIKLSDAIFNNKVTPPSPLRDAWLYMRRSDAYAATNNIGLAHKELDEAFRLQPSVDIAIQQARLFYRAKLYKPAIIQLKKAQMVDTLRNPLLPSRIKEIENARSVITEAMTTAKNNS